MPSEFHNDFGEEIRENRERQQMEFNLFRSGSAPPTVEGSIRGPVSDEMRSDPAYAEYYYANAHLNPRLPPPVNSKEDWRVSRRLHNGGGNGVIGSAMSVRSDAEPTRSVGGSQWSGDGLIGMPVGLGLGNREKSLEEIFQGDVNQTRPLSRQSSRPISRNVYEGNDELPSVDPFVFGDSLPRIITPDPFLPVNHMDKRSLDLLNSFNGISSGVTESTDLLSSAFAGMDLSSNAIQREHFDQRRLVNVNPSMGKIGGIQMDPKNTYLMSNGSIRSNNPNLSRNSYLSVGPHSLISPSHNPNLELMTYGSNGYAYNPRSPSMIDRGIDARALSATEYLQNLNRMGNFTAPNALHLPIMDPLYDPMMNRNCMANSQLDLVGFRKAHLGALLASQRSQCGVPNNGRSGCVYYDFSGNPAYGMGMPFVGSPLAGEFVPRFPSGMINFGGNSNEGSGSSLLNEFKNNKARCFELFEIANHVVEFSADQYGSRFIQQKLENATIEEKNMIFSEIMPRAITLMTDVFGNYVIQKFFDHGSPTQIRDMVNQLNGNVLYLSQQMYGCRVVQKAIEVAAVKQQIDMVSELEGSVMKCVRDQNGNHVIQKCIECVPEESIQFIILEFYDQVVTLSIHPYGCRVIQRVLEHCHDPETQKIMMDAILESVCKLAQDQYGNYVVQHVLEHGLPQERSYIIRQLTGQIVHMSLQKYASNVVEKCLTFGNIEERHRLVTEMLGPTDENEPLQIMMKDQFANYVVQKVLETCDEQQLEVILNRIKVHLNALKKYTYGKHIVSRVEKLVAAGEKRIGIQTMRYRP